jgi:ABC-type uncharacterized transport system involved in gliding motility auxiliary subunit
MSLSSGGKRRAAQAGLFSGGILVVAAILLAVNWLSYRHWLRGDWTKAKIYSLSDTTRKVVAGLKAPVQVSVFMTHRSRLYSEVKELLGRYRALSPAIKVEEIDPERNPARAEIVAQQLDVRKTGTVVFQSGAKKKFVTEDQIAEFDFGGAPGQGGSLKSFKGEAAFTSAILEVTSARSPKVYFLAGHGEKSPEDSGDRGYSEIKDLLTKDDDSVAEWESLGKSDVPKDADLVVLAGPKTALLEPEKGALEKYLNSGGHVLLMLDPVNSRAGGPPPDFGLGAFLAEWGVKLDNDIVVDPGNALPFMGAETVYVNHFGSHAIVAPLSSAKMAVILPLARSVSAGTAAKAGFTGTVLLQTTQDGWGETDLENLSAVKKDDKDVPAPVSLGLAVSRGTDAAKDEGSGNARLVVYGDSDFGSNAQLQNVSNANLFLNTVHWLVGSTQLVGITPKAPEQNTLVLAPGTLRRVGLLSLVVLPGLAILAGVLVWWRRRS